MSDSLITLRKTLHRYPDLSGAETATATTIKNFIAKQQPTYILENIGGAGLAALYQFGAGGPTIVFRCELDALPIEEANVFDHRSTVPGVSHKCGHDGHMSIVAGLAVWLRQRSFSQGRVVLLFQPAEETGRGAAKVLEDERFRRLRPDHVFALHNIPGEPLHRIITMDAGFSAEVISFALQLRGREAHAAEPENAINPSMGMAEIITGLSAFNQLDPAREDFTVLTPVHLRAGQPSYGISPANGELHYTIRSWDGVTMANLRKQIIDLIDKVGSAHGLVASLDWLEHFPASRNDEVANDILRQAAKRAKLETVTRPYPFRFGEDFGWFSREYPATMFGLGAGEKTPALHHANYDFPDDLIETGVKIFASIIEEILS